MSVINKMLRDLDQRTQSATTPDSVMAAPGIRQGTAAVGAVFTQQASGRRVRYGLVSTVVLAVAGLAAAFGWWQAKGRVGTAVTVAQVPAAKVASAASAALPVAPAPSVQASAPVPDLPATAQPAPRQGKIENAKSLGTVRAPAAAIGAAVPAPAMALRMETALGLRSLNEPATVARPSSAPAPANDRARQQASHGTAPSPMVTTATAAQDALAQAQTLWNAASKDAAVELLRDAVAIAERTGPSGGNAALLPLVRELTRMQLAEGHFGAVWDLLHRLEPHLGNQADLWAIRANAAQRLGRHQDSVHAYRVALQSRPNEQRWLLGSAVSLAALGQTASASEMADKARAAGPISKDVQAYLRQMNVPIKD